MVAVPPTTAPEPPLAPATWKSSLSTTLSTRRVARPSLAIKEAYPPEMVALAPENSPAAPFPLVTNPA